MKFSLILPFTSTNRNFSTASRLPKACRTLSPPTSFALGVTVTSTSAVTALHHPLLPRTIVAVIGARIGLGRLVQHRQDDRAGLDRRECGFQGAMRGSAGLDDQDDLPHMVC